MPQQVDKLLNASEHEVVNPFQTICTASVSHNQNGALRQAASCDRKRLRRVGLPKVKFAFGLMLSYECLIECDLSIH